MSHGLSERGIDHVVLEHGEVASSWRTERWDSLRLLTPNWLTRLPGGAYQGADPDGYMTATEVVGFLSAYGRSFAAPVQTATTVLGVAAPATATWSRRIMGRLPAGPWSSPPGRAARPRCPPWPRGCQPPSASSPPSTTAAPTAGRRAGARRRSVGVGRPGRRRAGAKRPRRHARRRRPHPGAAHLPGSRHPLVDGRAGTAPDPLRRGRRHRQRRGDSRRSSSSARPSGAPSISTPCATSACAWSGDSSVSTGHGRSCPALSPTSVPMPI